MDDDTIESLCFFACRLKVLDSDAQPHEPAPEQRALSGDRWTASCAPAAPIQASSPAMLSALPSRSTLAASGLRASACNESRHGPPILAQCKLKTARYCLD